LPVMNVLPALANFQAFHAEATGQGYLLFRRTLPIHRRKLAMARIVISATGAEALTFDDVLLQPGHSEIMPGQTNIATRIARDIDLSLPILSSAMDTVTESRLAIAMAQS